MQSIAVSELRANLMKVLNNLKSNTSINITSRGKVIATLIPPKNELKSAEDKLARLRKTAKVHDILSPISEDWSVEN